MPSGGPKDGQIRIRKMRLKTDKERITIKRKKKSPVFGRDIEQRVGGEGQAPERAKDPAC